MIDVEALFLDRCVTVTEEELLQRSGITGAELHALVDSGALAPASSVAGRWTFTVECLAVARTAFRLRNELDLDDTHALAVVLRLAQRVDELQNELVRLRAGRQRR
jgi:chaperone modulatory protein CbpM